MSGPLKEEAVRGAFKCDIILYDASYVALIRTLKVTLYTADEELISKTIQLGVVKHIRP